MSASQFEKLGRSERREAAAHLCVLARVEPSHKQQLVELLQEDGQVLPELNTVSVHSCTDLKRNYRPNGDFSRCFGGSTGNKDSYWCT